MLPDTRIKHIKRLAEGTAQSAHESLLLGALDSLLAERKELIERNAKLLKGVRQWIEDDIDHALELAGKGEADAN